MSEPQAPIDERQRPLGVTVVLALVWLAAVGDLVASIWLLIVSFDKARFATAPVGVEYVRYWALVALVIGVLTALVAYGLGRGSQFLRVLTMLVMALRLVNAVWAMVAIRYVTVWPAVFDAAIAIVVISLLGNRSASDYFRGRTRRSTTPSGSIEPLHQEDQ